MNNEIINTFYFLKNKIAQNEIYKRLYREVSSKYIK